MAALLLGTRLTTHAEDDYRLWLRCAPMEAPLLESYRRAATQLVMGAHSDLRQLRPYALPDNPAPIDWPARRADPWGPYRNRVNC